LGNEGTEVVFTTIQFHIAQGFKGREAAVWSSAALKEFGNQRLSFLDKSSEVIPMSQNYVVRDGCHESMIVTAPGTITRGI
jgi:hypothetical protein